MATKSEIYQYLISRQEDMKRQEQLQEFSRGGKVSKKKRLRSFAKGGGVDKYQTKGEVTKKNKFNTGMSVGFNDDIYAGSLGVGFEPSTVLGDQFKQDVGRFNVARDTSGSQGPGNWFDNLSSNMDWNNVFDAGRMGYTMAGMHNYDREPYRYEPVPASTRGLRKLESLKPRTEDYQVQANRAFQGSMANLRNISSPGAYVGGVGNVYGKHLQGAADIQKRKWDQEMAIAQTQANAYLPFDERKRQDMIRAEDWSQDAVDAARMFEQSRWKDIEAMGSVVSQNRRSGERDDMLADIYGKTYGQLYNLPTGWEGQEPTSTYRKRSFGYRT